MECFKNVLYIPFTKLLMANVRKILQMNMAKSPKYYFGNLSNWGHPKLKDNGLKIVPPFNSYF